MRTSINDIPQVSQSSNNGFKVGFFSLKDGERAIVRFLIRNADDFNVYTAHSVDIGNNKTMRVDCLRDFRQPVDICPMCKANIPIGQKCYINLIRYYQNEDGTIVGKPQMWERSVRSSNVTDLNEYLNDYSDLSQIVCAITRRGTGLDTKYTISPNLPNSQIYPSDFSAFDGYSPMGGLIKSWTAAEMNEFLMTGAMPEKHSKSNSIASANSSAASSTSVAGTLSSMDEPAYDAIPWNDNVPMNDTLSGSDFKPNGGVRRTGM